MALPGECPTYYKSHDLARDHVFFSPPISFVDPPKLDPLTNNTHRQLSSPQNVQSFGAMVAFYETNTRVLSIQVASDNVSDILGYSVQELLDLDSFLPILKDDDQEVLIDHLRDLEEMDTTGRFCTPVLFPLFIKNKDMSFSGYWCALHARSNAELFICEFERMVEPSNSSLSPVPHQPRNFVEIETTDERYPKRPRTEPNLETTADDLENFEQYTTMDVLNTVSRISERFGEASSLDNLYTVFMEVVQSLTKFQHTCLVKFDQRVSITELTKIEELWSDGGKLVHSKNSSKISLHAKDLIYLGDEYFDDRDQQPPSKLIYRYPQNFAQILGEDSNYLRIPSQKPNHFFSKAAPRSFGNVPIKVSGEVWASLFCYNYQGPGTKISFLTRRICQELGMLAAQNVLRLTESSQIRAQRSIFKMDPSLNCAAGKIISSKEDLLKAFDADYGFVVLRGELRILGSCGMIQVVLPIVKFFQALKTTAILSSQCVSMDFPELAHKRELSEVGGLLLVPFSSDGVDFLILFRGPEKQKVDDSSLENIKKSGNKTVVGIEHHGRHQPEGKSVNSRKCEEWTSDHMEIAALICVIYQKLATLSWAKQPVRQPSDGAITSPLKSSTYATLQQLESMVQYLGTITEQTSDEQAQEFITKSCVAAKSLIYSINDSLELMDLSYQPEMVEPEVFDLSETILRACEVVQHEAARKCLSISSWSTPDVEWRVVGNERRIRQAICNLLANAVEKTSTGGIKTHLRLLQRWDDFVEIEILVSDSGIGMSKPKLEALVQALEEVSSVEKDVLEEFPSFARSDRVLGLGLATVARLASNMRGELHLKTTERTGLEATLRLPFALPEV